MLPTTTSPLQKQTLSPNQFTNLAVDYLTPLFETALDQLFPHQGLLLLDSGGDLIHSSPKARSLCVALSGHSDSPPQPLTALPEQILTLSQLMLESRELFPDQPIRLYDDILVNQSTRIHLNAAWLNLDYGNSAYLLISLEDSTAITHQRALFEAHRYRLTPRETEVWTLYRQGLSYRQVGKQLFITLNTVKRHMKSIYEKQRGEVI